MGRKKLTLDDWKKRALLAESEFEGAKNKIVALENGIVNLTKDNDELTEDLRWANESRSRLQFYGTQHADKAQYLTNVIAELGSKLEKEYHNCEENLKNRNQMVNQQSTIDYAKKQQD